MPMSNNDESTPNARGDEEGCESINEADAESLDCNEDGVGFGGSPFKDDKPISARPEEQK